MKKPKQSAQPTRKKLTLWVSICAILLASIAGSLLVSQQLRNLRSDQAMEKFKSETTKARLSILSRVGIYENVLEGGQGLLSASSFVDRDEWKAYVDAIDIQKNYPGIQGMGYAIFVTPEEKEAHIEQIRSEGFPDYTIKPAGERDIYTSIIYLEPFDERNKQAFGFDMYQESNRRNAMDRARDTNSPQISRRITLVQEIDDDVQPGFLVYVPHYENGTQTRTLQERRDSIVGFSYAPFRARNFIEGAIGEGGITDIALELFDGNKNEMSQENLLYDDTSKIGSDAKNYHFTALEEIEVAGMTWTIKFTGIPNYGENKADSYTYALVLLFGLSIGILFSFILYNANKSKSRAITYAENVTKDLKLAKEKAENLTKETRKSKEDLQAKMEEMERLNQTMIDRELKMIEMKKKIKDLRMATSKEKA